MSWFKTIIATALTVFLTGVVSAEIPGAMSKPDEATQAKLVKAYGKTPLAFEANAGQTDGQVKFISRGSGYNLFLTPTESVMVLHKSQNQGDGILSSPSPLAGEGRGEGNINKEKLQTSAIRMQLVDANPSPAVFGQDQLPGKSNYFTGKDPAKWRTNVANYKKVHYKEVYPGIDLVYYGNQRKLEYDFIIAPGADPKAIELAFQGTDDLTLDSHGNLILHTATGDVTLQAPIIYQEINGARQTINGQ